MANTILNLVEVLTDLKEFILKLVDLLKDLVNALEELAKIPLCWHMLEG